MNIVDLNSIKKIQLQINETLIEIKNIYREIAVEWVKPRIISMIWSITNQRTATQNNKKKKESKQMRIVYTTSGTTLRGPTFVS